MFTLKRCSRVFSDFLTEIIYFLNYACITRTDKYFHKYYSNKRISIESLFSIHAGTDFFNSNYMTKVGGVDHLGNVLKTTNFHVGDHF